MEHWIQTIFTPRAQPFFDAVSDLGTGAPLTIGLLFVFLIFGTVTGIRAGLLFLTGSYLTFFLKIVIAAPRPYFADESIIAYSLSSGYGMPSGHSTHTAAALSPIVKDAKNSLVKLALIIFIGLVLLSRVYLGVHYVSQVIVGLAIGIALFLFFETVGAYVVSRLKRFSRRMQAIILIIPFLFLFGINHLIVSSYTPSIPKVWQQKYDNAVELRAKKLGIEISDARVQERKNEFSLIESRGNEFFSLVAGWLIVCFIFLKHPVFKVFGLKHMLANLTLGAGIIGSLYFILFIAAQIYAFQLILLLFAPSLVAYLIPSITSKWFYN